MKEVKIKSGQTLVDIAIQELGDTGRVLELAELNELNVTDELVSGTSINVPDYDVDKRNVVNAFSAPALQPASGLSSTEDEEVLPEGEGIDYWIIENDFVVQ